MGIEESAVVLAEEPEVLDIIDQTVALADEGEGVNLDAVIHQARTEVRGRQAQQAARQQAAERNATYVDSADLASVLGLGRAEYPAQRQLHDDKAIAAAQEGGTLVVSHSTPSAWAMPTTQFFTTQKTKQDGAGGEAASSGAASDRNRSKANRARRAALLDIVQTPPKLDVIRAELLAWAIAGGGWSSSVMDVARPLLHAANLVGEDATYWEVKQALQSLADREQHHAVWIMMIARRDESVGLPLHADHWGAEHLEHYAWMIEHGYEPGEWEQQMLTAARESQAQAEQTSKENADD